MRPGLYAEDMRNQWVIWLLIVGVAYVYGNPCDVSYVTNCYTDLVHYEGISFPLYGMDDKELDETCGHINSSFECIENYHDNCDESPECDEACREIIGDIKGFAKNTGLRSLVKELCNSNSAIREIYLENYSCLDSNKDSYAACHNDSQLSQEYMSTILGEEVILAKCCFFTWYHDCFTNVTQENCGVNATFFVSFAMHKLTGHILSQLCKSVQVPCDRPPLAIGGGDYEHDGNKIDEDKADETDEDIDNTIDEDKVGEIDKNTDNNSIDNKKNGCGSLASFSFWIAMFSYFIILLSKRNFDE